MGEQVRIPSVDRLRLMTHGQLVRLANKLGVPCAAALKKAALVAAICAK